MLLGDFVLKRHSFPDLDGVFKEFETKEFQGLIDRKRSEWVNRVLLELIQKEEEPCFLLPAILEYVERIEKQNLLAHYTFNSFELWLNHFSTLSAEENFRIRAKIVGKAVERSDYQVFFPIGMGKVYEGSHFVTAHRSPDLDTTISSFWGWMDAFGARVGSGLHLWNVPGGPPISQIEIDLMFRDYFGAAVFTHLPKTKTALTLTGNDLLTSKPVLSKMPKDSFSDLVHDRDDPVVLVDEAGFYLEDWRPSDVEGVRGVILLLSSCLRWFENQLNLRMLALFAQSHPVKGEVELALRRLFELKISECEPAGEFTSAQNKDLERFLMKVLNVRQGRESSFEELSLGLSKLGMFHFLGVDALLVRMDEAHLFDALGHFNEHRPALFHFLEQYIRQLHEAIFKIRSRLEEFDIALSIKSKVFGQEPMFVSVRSDVEEIRNKMGSNQHLTVTYPDQGRFYPVGVVLASDVRKTILGTASLRDFCNREEMTIPSYIEVISVIDHHKSTLNTYTPPMAVIGDAQSSNTLVAERAFQINDRHSLGGMTSDRIEQELNSVREVNSPEEMRRMQRLLEKRLAAQNGGAYFIHPMREMVEYLHFLYGILDDTDLLSKVTVMDVEVTASLLNRLKSLMLKKEVEIVNFDDLPKDKSFLKKAAKRLLQNEDLHSLYRKVYLHREKEVEKMIQLCADRKPSTFFADTKEQNGCCRIGQTKLFANNVAAFEKKADALRHHWLEIAQKTHEENREIDLHLHMISTVVGADDVFKGIQGKVTHRDELWLWCSPDETGVAHLKNFLNSFRNSPGVAHNHLEVEFLGSNGEELDQIFKESFLEIPRKRVGKPDLVLPIAILKVNPGSLNSRKALVSPFLPSLAK